MFRRVVCITSCLVALSLPLAASGPEPSENDDWSGHLNLLNELSERRRTSSFFANEQNTGHGLQIGHVNLAKGNLTFLRRDLVTTGRLPIVAGRVYDSAAPSAGDFGLGWRLTFDESVRQISEQAWVYIDESASMTRLTRTEKGWSWSGDELAAAQLSDGIWTLTSLSGLEKTFLAIGKRHRLARVNDPYGNHLTLAYSDGALHRIENSSGRFVTIDRDSAGRVRSFGDQQGREVSFAYDATGRLAATTDLGGFEWRYIYSGEGLISVTDPLGHPALAATYDSAGRVANIDVRGQSLRYEYRDGETRVIDAKGQVSSYRHDANGRLVSIRNALGMTTAIERQKDGWHILRDGLRDDLAQTNLKAKRASDPARFARSATGDVVSMRESDQSIQHFTYNPDGQVIEAIGTSGKPVRFQYDAFGRLAVAALGDGEVHRYTYNARGLRLSVTSDTARSEFGYDEAGRLQRVLWSRGEEKGGYDYELDAANRVIAIETLDGQRVTIDYDLNGNVIRYGERIYTYDALDRLISIVDDHGTDLRREYFPDEQGLLEAADRRTPVHAVAAARASAVYGSVGDIFHSRGRGALEPGVRYDPATKTLRALVDDGEPTSHLPIKVALLRTQIERVTRGLSSTFNAGSNAFFLPPESKAVGCTMECNVWSLSTRIDGSTSSTVTVDAGQPVVIFAWALAQCSGDSIRYRIDFTNNGSWDQVVFDPALITSYAYSNGPTQTRVEAYCQCTGLTGQTITTVSVRQVTERVATSTDSEIMSGSWPNTSGTASAPILFTNTVREQYTVRETFINGSLNQRQILAGYSTLVTTPGGFPGALPYDSISLLNSRHRFRNPGATTWMTMGGPTSPIMIGPDSVFKQVTSSVTFPVNNTGSGEVEIQGLALGGFPGVVFAFPIPSPFGGVNGLINDTTDTSMGF